MKVEISFQEIVHSSQAAAAAAMSAAQILGLLYDAAGCAA
jgi:hypothetical protein